MWPGNFTGHGLNSNLRLGTTRILSRSSPSAETGPGLLPTEAASTTCSPPAPPKWACRLGDANANAAGASVGLALDATASADWRRPRPWRAPRCGRQVAFLSFSRFYYFRLRHPARSRMCTRGACTDA